MNPIANKCVLVTGASGFVGRELLKHLVANPLIDVRGAVRRKIEGGIDSAKYVYTEPLGPNTFWKEALEGVDVVVHTAARVHMLKDSARNALSEFRYANVAGTLQLARQAAAAGVQRFVFLSSIKVNGELTFPNRPFRANDPPMPMDPYAVSKYEAEQGLWEIHNTLGMDVVVIRPTLVYGQAVRANFHRMMQCLYRGIPLPLAGIDNLRSLVSLDNLVDFIQTCASHAAAANRTWLVSDGEDLSTPELLRQLGSALNRPARLFAVPEAILLNAIKLIGRADYANRLLGSLQVDISKTREILNWSPPKGTRECLIGTALHFLDSQKK
ncbi:MAG: NAD-dependent epimerase/dehydratase family protein [Pseudomonadales bacterium]